MKLYFQNSFGEERLIAELQTEEEVMPEIYKFIDKCNAERTDIKPFKSYYTRTWLNRDGCKVFDVGSHTEFFILEW